LIINAYFDFSDNKKVLKSLNISTFSFFNVIIRDQLVQNPNHLLEGLKLISDVLAA